MVAIAPAAEVKAARAEVSVAISMVRETNAGSLIKDIIYADSALA
jgi:hypothetical protein